MTVLKNGGFATASCTCGKAKLLLSGVIAKNKTEAKPHVSKEVADSNSAPAEGVFPHVCSKCGHGEGYVKDLGAFLGDESNVYLFKCAKCGHTDRQADGCSNL